MVSGTVNWIFGLKLTVVSTVQSVYGVSTIVLFYVKYISRWIVLWLYVIFKMWPNHASFILSPAVVVTVSEIWHSNLNFRMKVASSLECWIVILNFFLIDF